MPKQLSLFSQPSLNVGKKLKEQLALSAKQSRYSREELLDRINDLAGRYGVRLVKGNGHGLNMAMLEKWLNKEAMEYVPSINAMVVICAALEDIGPIQEVISPLGCMLIDENEARMLLWAKEYHRAKDARNKMRKLESEL